MLLVDKIEELELGERVRGYKNVTINEAFFQGHYPDMPIMPGVLVLESMSQVGAIMLLADPKFEGFIPIVAGYDKVRFRKPVLPGDRLTTEAKAVWFRNNLGRITVTATVDGEIVAKAEISFKIIKNGEIT